MVLAQGVQLVRNAERLRRRTAINHAGLAELDLVLQSNVTFDDIKSSATELSVYDHDEKVELLRETHQ